MRGWLRARLPPLLAAAAVLLPASAAPSRAALNDRSAQIGAAVAYDELQALCDRILAGPTATNMEALRLTYAAVTNLPIREAVTAAMGLYWLARQQTAEADTFANHLRRAFPNSKYLFLLEREGNLVPCDRCKGLMQVVVACPDCAGSGRCRRCRGTGKVAGLVGAGSSFAPVGSGGGSVSLGGGTTVRTPAHGGGRTITPIHARPETGNLTASYVPCPGCDGGGQCPTCKGQKTGKEKCPACVGTGTAFTPRAHTAFVDVVGQLKALAFAAGQAERGFAFAEGRWRDREEYARLQHRRADERAYFSRVAEEAGRARDAATAVRLLDDAIRSRADSPYTGDVLRLRAVIRAESSEPQPREWLGPQRAAAAASSAKQEIPAAVHALLDAGRRRTNAPALWAADVAPKAPVGFLGWRLGEPALLDRTARVPVEIDFPSPAGLPMPENWTILLEYGTSWKVWQAAAP